MAGSAAAVARIAHVRRRLETTAGGQLPGSEHVLPLVGTVAALPPVAPIARVWAPTLIMLGTTIPWATARVAIGRDGAGNASTRAT